MYILKTIWLIIFLIQANNIHSMQLVYLDIKPVETRAVLPNFDLPKIKELIQSNKPAIEEVDEKDDQSKNLIEQNIKYHKAIYINYWAASSASARNKLFELIDNSDINTVVIDVKNEYGDLFYNSDIKTAQEVFANNVAFVKDSAKFLAPFKQRNLYIIARMSIFKDALLAKNKPQYAIKNKEGDVWLDANNLAWSDPFNEEVRSYNVQIAVDVAKMGFDEVQFDYVRFPGRSGLSYSKTNTQTNRVNAIKAFLQSTQEMLKPLNVKTSFATFGYACWNKGDTYIGHQLTTLAPFVDYISPMLYPSSFQYGVIGYKNGVEHPGKVVELSLNNCTKLTGLAPGRFRPWLQAFTDYSFDKRKFLKEQIQQQINAAEDFKADGWILWNPSSRYQLESINAAE
ncbi:MAG: putative glycoside hydrolase [Saccharospirillaceae bacterium]|nr:putative glycoside hydrolase [Pseudomonadales bacterium]NRB77879.1 putative glycoside hydrolase [Saccharospirillaceae bacterium]